MISGLSFSSSALSMPGTVVPTPRNPDTSGSTGTDLSGDSVSLSATAQSAVGQPETTHQYNQVELNCIRAGEIEDPQQPGLWRYSDGRVAAMECDKILTASDRKLVESINGGKLDGGNPDVSNLITTIANERVYGSLKGNITPAYIQGLISGQKRDAALNQQQAAAAYAAGDLVKARAFASQGPSISYDVLDQALASLTTS
jgi:hypothetical protein